MKVNLIYLFLIIVFTACSSGSQNDDPEEIQIIEQVDLTNAWDKPQDVMLSSIADSIFYIPLETKDGSYLSDDIEVVILRKHLLVYENNKVLRLYDKNGKYLLTYGCQGKGPGEYLHAREFSCDEDSDRVYILDSMARKLIIYNIAGDLIDEIKIYGLASRIVVKPNHNLGLLYLSFGNRMDTARLEWVSPLGKLQNKIPLYKDRLYAKTGTRGSTSIYWINGQLRISEPPFDTIYQLDQNMGFIGSTRIVIGPNALPRQIWFNSKLWRKEYINYKSIHWLFESEHYIFIQTIGINQGLFIHNRLTNESTKIGSIERNDYWFFGLQNDLDGGLPFWPNSFSGDYLVGSTSPYLINTYRNGDSTVDEDPNFDSKYRTRFLEMTKKLNRNDNPIVVIVRMKSLNSST